MKNLLLFAVALLIACTGPAGPAGPAGDDGEPGPATFYTTSGVLYTSSLVDGLYWDINNNYWINDKMLIQVWVRKGAGQMWQTPEWYLYSWYLRIIKDNVAQEQHEYLVIGCSPGDFVLSQSLSPYLRQ